MPLALRAFLGLLLALIPAVMVQIEMEAEARSKRAAEESILASHFVRLVASQVELIVDGARQTLLALAAHADLRASVPSRQCDEFLARVVAGNPGYLTANLFAHDGRAICSAFPLASDVNVAARPYFQRVLATGEFQIGEYAVGRGTGQPSLHFAMPLTRADGPRAGVLVVAFSVEALNAALSRLSLPETSAATVTDRDGIILARSRETQRFVGRRLPDWAMPLLNAPEPGVFDGPALDGVRRIAAYLPVSADPQGLFISVGLNPASSVDTAVKADRRSTIIIVGSLLLTLTLGLLVFHGAVEAPIQRMLATAARWKQQEWRARVGNPGGAREFVRLAEAFDEMAAAVESHETARRRALSRLQAVIELAPQVVITADTLGRVDWVNPIWTEVTGQSSLDALGEGWLSAFVEEDREAVSAAISAAAADARLGGGNPSFSVEARVQPASGGARWFALRGAPQVDEFGLPLAWLIVGVDIDKLRRAEAEAINAMENLEATYRAAPAGVCLLDRQLRFLHINPDLARVNGAPPDAHIGRTLRDMAPQIADQVEGEIRRVLETGEPVLELEVRGEVEGEPRVWLCNYAPVLDPTGKVRGVSGAVIDITARKQMEESERLFSREVDHRAQNVLTVARSLVRLSAAEADGDIATLVQTLEGRIGALSRANSLLTRERWLAAELRALLEQELGVHAPRITLSGPSVRLEAAAVQPLTLVMHELATNAAKYGALSTPEGRVDVSWVRHAEGLTISWTERGGPAITSAPERQGFGSLLIDSNLSAALAGRIHRDWSPGGLVCELQLGRVALLGGTSVRAGHLAGRRVLVVEGDPQLRVSLTDALQFEDATVVGPAVNAREALALLASVGRVDAAIVSARLGGPIDALITSLERRALVTLWLDDGSSVPASAGRSLVAIAASGGAEVVAALLALWRPLESDA